MLQEEPKSLSIGALISSNATYFIPLYQRDYAWTDKEVRQLLSDIASACASKKNCYHVGNLVVDKKEDGAEYEVIDGQQRLTTFHLINAALGFCKVDQANVRFSQLRPKAEKFIKRLYANFDYALSDISDAPTQMRSTASCIKYIWNEVLDSYPIKDDTELKSYIRDKVEIIRIPVPEYTDLNRYFEVMNSRGEQLEKHEVLKANLMARLKVKEANLMARLEVKDGQGYFSQIWDKCSDMNSFCHENDLTDNTDTPSEITLSTILKSSQQVFADNRKSEKNEEVKQSIIDFPNFLMIVLRIFTENDEDGDNEDGDDVPLDDSRLLEWFDLKLNTNSENIIKFIDLLWEKRLEFDKCIIWSSETRWSLGLKGDKRKTETEVLNDDSKSILAIQTMFHSSYPSRSYKYWLYHALRHGADKLNKVDFWEDMARRFLRGRYSKEKVDYAKLMGAKVLSHEIDEPQLRYGQPIVFALKLFDYLIWKGDNAERVSCIFSSDRNSIEHFYPQNPESPHPSLDESLHQFGNLCLVSSSMNSKFTNNLPDAKMANYERLEHNSLKLKKMMAQCSCQDKPWYPYGPDKTETGYAISKDDSEKVRDTIKNNTKISLDIFKAFLDNKIEDLAKLVAILQDTRAINQHIHQ